MSNEDSSREKFEHGEMKFRIGAHHAVTRLAEAIEHATSVEECQRIVDTFADLIGDGRRRAREDFSLDALIFEARKRVRGR